MPEVSIAGLAPPSSAGASRSASVQALLREGSSDNTLASYRSALNYWATWFELRFGRSITLPLEVDSVICFITDHVEHVTDNGLRFDLPPDVDAALVRSGVKRRLGPFKLSTVQHRIAVLSEAHESQRMANPCRTREVQTLLSRTRAAYARRGSRPTRKDALTREPFEALLSTCDESLIGLRDRAMLLFAWSSGGRRRSEVVAATVENTRRTPDGYVYTLSHSKTNREGSDHPDMFKPIVGRAALALDAWLMAAGIAEGALFRRVRRGGVVAGPLRADSLRQIVHDRALIARLEGDFAAHSLRSGFVTEAARQGVPIPEVMTMTGHASLRTVTLYHRVGQVTSRRSARLLDEPMPGDSP
ncbi:site-specific integrase [Achromobacter kerstersii]|uniref:Tyrosine recombinase XerC n=1 Tax=Achromobacter kerstersii TaxID=1353890 RepID=A0A6S6ZUZ4_9BURK|nr:site-specific integrase [Achromobacter kerstersii]CAB3663164.1 Tyrosine recombinase XerC [Achromobacter kerstersii]